MKMRMNVLTQFRAPKAPQTIVTMVPQDPEQAGWVVQVFMPLNDSANILGAGTVVDVEIVDNPDVLAPAPKPRAKKKA